jgi:serine/threonine protein kinase
MDPMDEGEWVHCDGVDRCRFVRSNQSSSSSFHLPLPLLLLLSLFPFFSLPGAFAHVYAVRSLDSSESFALKRISVPSYDAEAVASVNAELSLMVREKRKERANLPGNDLEIIWMVRSLFCLHGRDLLISNSSEFHFPHLLQKTLCGHPKVIRLVDSSVGRRGESVEHLVLMELATRGGLVQMMNARINAGRFVEREVLKIFSDVAQGVAAMHSMSPPVAHRDLKVLLPPHAFFLPIIWCFSAI